MYKLMHSVRAQPVICEFCMIWFYLLLFSFLIKISKICSFPYVMAMTDGADLIIVHLLLIGALKSVFSMAVKFQPRKGENS